MKDRIWFEVSERLTYVLNPHYALRITLNLETDASKIVHQSCSKGFDFFTICDRM